MSARTGLRGLIFDLDGTLADTLPLCYAAFNHVFRRYTGEEYTAQQIRAMFGPSEEGILQRRIPDRWEEALEAFLRFYREQHDVHARRIPGIAPVLGWLRQRGTAVGVVTGKGAQSAAITLKHFALMPHIDAVRGGSAEGGRKPRAMREILDEWQMAAAQVGCIGDAPSDMRAAVEVGAVPAGAAWAPGTDAGALRAAGAAVVLHSPAALRAWLALRLAGQD